MQGRIGAETFWCSLVLAGVAFFVLYPIVLIVVNSFQIAKPGMPPLYGLDGWRAVLAEPGLRRAVYNTFSLLAARQLLSFPLAVLIAWLLARTDLPGKSLLEFMFWVSFFLPSLSVTLGWILILDPDYGIANQIWKTLTGAAQGPFNIYSFWGIVWAHIGHNTTAVKVMLLTPAFRNMDASLEEASEVAGASALGTLVRILIPIMTPIFIVVLILAIINSLHAFEVEMILGAPIGFYVYSTKVYQLVQQEPPLFGPATALSTVLLLILLPLIITQRRFIARRQYTTITGRYRAKPIALGKWKYPAVAFVAVVALLITLAPMAFVLIGTFMSLFGFFHIEHAWTLANWRRVFDDPIFLLSLKNTLLMAFGAAAFSVSLFSIVAYISVKTKFFGRAALDFISWFPSAMPGILMGIGLLWLFLDIRIFRPLYGSLWLLVIATVISSITLGTQLLKSTLLQLGQELEEASEVAGASWLATYRRIVAPLMFPMLLLVGVLGFIHAARDISNVALLATSSSRTLALLQLDFMVSGRYESAAVVATIVMLLTTGVALIARLVGIRVGIRA
ncbi:MAG TPA: iron ABC transporter permease [Verrucomicrobiae bacterium]|nr:iron ABC transporter permease [Verrucomicrobiae bacterium]